MKLRILILTIFGTFVFNSCSTDSNSSNSTPQNLDLLPKRMLRDNITDGGTYIYDFFYDTNKIEYLKETFPNGIIHYYFFTYSGNLISKIELGNFTQHNLYGEVNYFYQNNRLIQIDSPSPSLLMGTTNVNINYNSDGTGNVIDYDGNEIAVFKITNDLLSYGMQYNINPANYIYASHNSPFKNIVGYKNLFLLHNVAQIIAPDTFIFGSTTFNPLNDQNGNLISYTLNSELYPIVVNYEFNVNTTSISYY